MGKHNLVILSDNHGGILPLIKVKSVAPERFIAPLLPKGAF